jgi:hypothetical protein
LTFWSAFEQENIPIAPLAVQADLITMITVMPVVVRIEVCDVLHIPDSIMESILVRPPSFLGSSAGSATETDHERAKDL